jgi:hypothetical protein
MQSVRSPIAAALIFSLAAIAAPGNAAPLFPSDSGIIDVRLQGAVGDGIADDTPAIRRAIGELPPYDKTHPYETRIIYFPAGTYRVSDTILRKDANGRFEPDLVLIGESRDSTIIKLADNAPGYGDRAHPKAIIYTSSGLSFTKDPRDGGRDYLGKGEGNEAFGNTVENLTVDAGSGNAGAVGIDFLANNAGAVRNVTIKAEGEAAVGLSMTRRWPGPALISGVSISGFDIGIDVAWTELSATLENVRIAGSRRYGLRNASNIVSFHDLEIDTTDGYGLANTGADGLIVGIGSHISGHGTDAVLNQGSVNFKDVVADNFTTADSVTIDRRLDGVFRSGDKISNPKWRLPILSPPVPPGVPADRWTNVQRFGAIPDERVDSTAAFVAAFRSDAAVVYIPTGRYSVRGSIPVGDAVERIEGMFSIINTGSDGSSKDPSYPLFIDSPTRKTPLFIRRLTVEKHGNMSAIIEHRSRTPFIMSDIVGLWGAALLNRPAEGGPVFADNTAAGYIRLAGSAGVWLRQLNTEGPRVRIVNDGAPLWVLGAKSEQTNTLVENLKGAESEIVGGFVYRGFGRDKQMPLFVNRDGRLVASYAEESFRPDAIYSVHLDSNVGGTSKVIGAEALPRRGSFARMAPSLSTE